MLFIGGTRNGQRLYVPWNHGNPVLKIPIERPACVSDIKTPAIYEIEIYIKKEIWKKNQHIFSIMVKNESDNLLKNYLDEYNEVDIEEKI